MRYKYAVVFRVPQSVKFPDKKTKANFALMQKQHGDLVQTLSESGVTIVEITSVDDCPVGSLHAGDAAVAINGTALICRPKKDEGFRGTNVSEVLRGFSWNVTECPEKLNGKSVHLEGCDVLFTGKEIFVGIRKHGTNIEGAIMLGRTFCDLPVIPIHMSDKSEPLTYYVSLAAPNILSIGKSKEAQNILRLLEQEATFSYQTITVDNDESASCLSFNGRIIFRQDKAEPKFTQLKTAGYKLWAHDVSELVKAGAPFSRYVLLLPELGQSPINGN